MTQSHNRAATEISSRSRIMVVASRNSSTSKRRNAAMKKLAPFLTPKRADGETRRQYILAINTGNSRLNKFWLFLAYFCSKKCCQLLFRERKSKYQNAWSFKSQVDREIRLVEQKSKIKILRLYCFWRERVFADILRFFRGRRRFFGIDVFCFWQVLKRC